MSGTLTFCRLCLNEVFISMSYCNGTAIELLELQTETMLLNIFPGMNTRLTTSLRLCEDCFNNANFISRVKEIFALKEIEFINGLQHSEIIKPYCKLCFRFESFDASFLHKDNYSTELIRKMVEIALSETKNIELASNLCCICWSWIKKIYAFKKDCFIIEEKLKLYSRLRNIAILKKEHIEEFLIHEYQLKTGVAYSLQTAKPKSSLRNFRRKKSKSNTASKNYDEEAEQNFNYSSLQSFNNDPALQLENSVAVDQQNYGCYAKDIDKNGEIDEANANYNQESITLINTSNEQCIQFKTNIVLNEQKNTRKSNRNKNKETKQITVGNKVVQNTDRDKIGTTVDAATVKDNERNLHNLKNEQVLQQQQKIDKNSKNKNKDKPVLLKRRMNNIEIENEADDIFEETVDKDSERINNTNIVIVDDEDDEFIENDENNFEQDYLIDLTDEANEDTSPEEEVVDLSIENTDLNSQYRNSHGNMETKGSINQTSSDSNKVEVPMKEYPCTTGSSNLPDLVLCVTSSSEERQPEKNEVQQDEKVIYCGTPEFLSTVKSLLASDCEMIEEVKEETDEKVHEETSSMYEQDHLASADVYDLHENDFNDIFDNNLLLLDDDCFEVVEERSRIIDLTNVEEYEGERCRRKRRSDRNGNRQYTQINMLWGCYICIAKFSTKKHLRKHLLIHEEPKNKYGRFECPKCPFRSRFKSSLTRHEIYHQKVFFCKKVIFMCPFCSVQYNTKGDIQSHMNEHIHSWKKFLCMDCTYSSSSSVALRAHYAKNHVIAKDPTFHQAVDWQSYYKHRHN